MQQSGIFRRSRRSVAVVVTVVVLVVAAGAAVGGYLLLRTKGSPQQTAASYLGDWQRGRYSAMDQVSVDVPRSGLAGSLRQAEAQLGIRRLRLAPGPVTADGGSARARFTVTADLASGHTWTYTGQLQLVRQDRRWWVSWSPSAIYPALHPGERFVLSAAWPPRAPVLGADGTVLSSPQVITESGSIQLLTGNVVQATAAQARALGAPYQAGCLIGQGGIEQVYPARLAGRPSLTIRIEGPANRVDATAARFAASPGQPVQTSLVMADQLAASRAVKSAATSKPVDLVAIQPSTGRVLAVVERPGGFDRALQGEFPPGSTFKVVTASALARTGLRPASTVQCPSQVNIGGRIFHNDNNERLGTTTLQSAFAVSCNSTFAMLATQRLSGPALRQAAQPQAISPAVLNTLRPMMRAVVTSGTAAGVGFPPGVYGKTGTAQYGNGPNPPSHGWFIGYRGDLAFAVLVEGGGTGADSAGPIANAFLRNLP